MWKILLFEVVILILAVGIWLAAPLVGIESKLYRVLIILGLVLPPIIYIVVKFILERRAAKGLEDGLAEQGKNQRDSARPDRQEEVDILNDNFAEAVSALKSSKVGGGRGNALYALPWYMIIGPPAAGKSTALLRSGLEFPYTSGDRKAIRGVGGTRNCDWWFSKEAILLDTAGRYTSEDEDLDEWLGFLGLLKKYRKKRPLNGLIVCVSVADIIQSSPDQIKELADRIRSRVDQVLAELEMVLPIYVLISKCDLLTGFVEYFADLKPTSRAQIFGFTVPLTGKDADIEGLFHREFEGIAKNLRKRVIHRLARSKTDERAAIYQFPLQLERARAPLAAFLSQLFVYNPYQETARLRGVYFCSGTQEGQPLNQLMGSMSQALGLPEAGAGAIPVTTTKKSYFLTDVFRRVLFPDQHLAGYTASGRSRRWRLRVATLVVGLLVSLGVIGLSAATFTNNRKVVGGCLELADKVEVRKIPTEDKELPAVKALDDLGAYNDQLAKWKEDGPPWHHRFGFYSGDDMLPVCRKVYVRGMKLVFTDKVADELEASLRGILKSTWGGSTDEVAKGYDILKTYLMLTNPKRLDVAFALPVVIGEWQKRLTPDVYEEEELQERQAGRYLRLLKSGAVSWPERNEDLVADVRRKLKDRDVLYVYNISKLGKDKRPLTIDKLLRGRVELAIRSAKDVPWVFTKEGRDEVAARIKKSGGEPWVLFKEAGAKPDQELRRRYHQKYIAAWMAFFRGLSVEQTKNTRQVLELLDKLTDTPSLYRTLLEESLDHLSFAGKVNDGVARTLIEEKGGKARKYMKLAERTGADDALKSKAKGLRDQNAVEEHFKQFHEFVKPKEEEGKTKVSGIEQYERELKRIKEELTAVQSAVGSGGQADYAKLNMLVDQSTRKTEALLRTMGDDVRPALRPLFIAPLNMTVGKLGVEEQSGAESGFQAQVCDEYNDKLGGRYPFADSRNDALLEDVAAVLKPDGVLWKHVEQNLSRFLEVKATGVELKTGMKLNPRLVRFLQRAHTVTRALFPSGAQTPQMSFDVRPYPAKVADGSGYAVSEITLEVDGVTKTYRNGPEEYWSFDWPGGGARKLARLTIRGDGGLRDELLFRGDWGLLRLVERATVTQVGNWYQLDFKMKDGNIVVRLGVKPRRSDHPLKLRRGTLAAPLLCY